MSEWISVKDRIPDKSGRYLVYTKLGSCNVFIAEYDGGIDDENKFGERFKERDAYTHEVIGYEWWPYYEITHWMLLPDPPEKT